MVPGAEIILPLLGSVLCQHRSKLQKKSLFTFLFQEDDAKQSHSGREYVYECFSSETINIMQGNASTKEDEEK